MNSPSPAAFGRVLVVSDDPATIALLRESGERFALFPEHCPDAPTALERLQRAKFEALFVDFRIGSQARVVVEAARQSPSNKHVVVFTVTDGEGEAMEASKAGSTFF